MHKFVFSFVLLTVVMGALPQTAQARDFGNPPIVAVFMMESRGSSLSGDELVGLTDYMATRLGEHGHYQIIPRDEIKKRLVDQKAKSYKDCVDRTCQIEIGRELAAQYSVSSTISKVGDMCLITASLFDLRKAATVRTASTKKGCSPDELIEAVEEITDKMQRTMDEGKKEETQPQPVPQPKPQPDPALSVQVGRCAKDTDCKGDRICVGGSCISPSGGASGPSAPGTNALGSSSSIPPSTGWAVGAGVLGIISSGVVLALAAGSELTKEDQIPAIPLGGAALITLAIMGPVTHAGARSAKGDNVRGSIALRVIGWVTFGITMVEGVGLIALGAMEVEPPDFFTLAAGAIGAASLISFSIDAFVARGQASRLIHSAELDDGQPEGVRISPVITPVYSPDGDRGADGAAFGLIGRF